MLGGVGDKSCDEGVVRCGEAQHGDRVQVARLDGAVVGGDKAGQLLLRVITGGPVAGQNVDVGGRLNGPFLALPDPLPGYAEVLGDVL